MGMIRIEMEGSFPVKSFATSADEGGHVMAIKRAIEFLTDRLGWAVVTDAALTRNDESPQKAPLGKDAE